MTEQKHEILVVDDEASIGSPRHGLTYLAITLMIA